MTRPHILIVEDQPAIRELIALNLQLSGFDASLAVDAEQADRLIRERLPDLVLVDWMLPGMPGIHLVRKLRNNDRTRDTPVIILTAKGTEQDKVTGLDAGADDYVTKPFSPKELLARVRAVLRRRAPSLSGETLKVGTLSLNPQTLEVNGDGQLLALGPTEFRLLRFFMGHTERVYTREQLLNYVWGDPAVVEERTIDVHIRRLRKALAPSGHDRHIQTVRGTGYRFVGSPT